MTDAPSKLRDARAASIEQFPGQRVAAGPHRGPLSVFSCGLRLQRDFLDELDVDPHHDLLRQNEDQPTYSRQIRDSERQRPDGALAASFQSFVSLLIFRRVCVSLSSLLIDKPVANLRFTSRVLA